jgi:hypothetical protein
LRIARTVMAATGRRPLADDGLLAEPKKRKVGTSEEKQQAVGSAATGTPPLPLGERKELARRYRQRRRVTNSEPAVSSDPRTSLPTVVKPEDPGTAGSVESPRRAPSSASPPISSVGTSSRSAAASSSAGM